MPARGKENSPVPTCGTPPPRAHARRIALPLNVTVRPLAIPRHFNLSNQNPPPFQHFRSVTLCYTLLHLNKFTSPRRHLRPHPSCPSHIAHFAHIAHFQKRKNPSKTVTRLTFLTFFKPRFFLIACQPWSGLAATPLRVQHPNKLTNKERSAHE